VGLPQVKLGWIAASGPSLQLRAALMRLELIADTNLSVSTPVQMAAAHLLSAGASVREQIRRRVLQNYHTLRQLVNTCSACQVLRAEGGWSAVVRIPHTMPEDERAIWLLEDHHVLVHPGYFFDFPRDGYVVISLLSRPDIFRAAAGRLFHAVAAG
jgi:aspartate/methionine/tyrosine aminotransferase